MAPVMDTTDSSDGIIGNKFPIRADWMVALVLAAATGAVYWEVSAHLFVNYDDTIYVTNNRQVCSGLSWSSIAWAFRTTTAGNWIPLTWLTHILDFQLYGFNSGGHHLTSLFIHLINVNALFFLLKRLTRALWRSAFVAALFAFHPLNVESVAWVAERKNVLCTLFWILGIWAYSRYAARPGWRRYAVVLLVFALGLMSKPMVVTLPLVLLLLDYWPLGRFSVTGSQRVSETETDPVSGKRARNGRGRVALRLVLEKVPLLLLGIADGIITVKAQVESGSVIKFPLGARIENAVVSYLTYIEKTIWPVRLAALYPHPPSYLPSAKVAFATVVLVFITIGMLWGARRREYLAVGWLWFLASLVPVIGIIQAGVQSTADRYAYIPLIGVFIIAVWGLSDLAERFRKTRDYVILGAVLVIFGFIIATRIQLSYWANSFALWKHAEEVTENNYVADNNLGEVLWSEGKTSDAAYWFQRSVETNPNLSDPQRNLGMALVQSGQLDEGIAHLKMAIELNPQSVDAYSKLGAALARKGRREDAIQSLEAGLRIDPQFAPALGNMGMIFAEQGDLDRAAGWFESGIRAAWEPGMVAQLHFAYGNLLVKRQELSRATEEYREAIKAKPDYFPASEALSKLQEKDR